MNSEFIEDYSFGKIVIDGERYTDDVILLGEKVIDGWWRERGHRVNKDDLGKIVRFDPDILIIGTGSSGRMKVPSSLSSKFEFEMESYPTRQACERYNELLQQDKKIAGGFHLTC
ncbi:MAG: Mth938-like domain-containing protein [Thermoplasmata archaeon]